MKSPKKQKFSLGSTKIQLAVVVLALIILTPQLIRLIKGDYSIKNVDFGLFGLALLVYLFVYFFATLVYICLVSKKISFGKTLLVQIASGFANKITPAGLGNMGLNTLYLWRTAKLSKTDAATIASANNLLGFIGYNILFWLLLIFGWANSEALPEFSGLILISLAIGTSVSIAYLVVRFMPSRHHRLKRALRDAWKSLSRLLKKPHRLMFGTLASIGITVCSLSAFSLVCRSVGLDLELSIIILAFSAGVAAIAVSPTPNGLGATEVAMTFVLTNAGVDNELALSAVLLFRIITFWMPILPGFLSFRYISTKGWI